MSEIQQHPTPATTQATTSTDERYTIKRALISVSDKTNLIPFATTLVELGISLLSTGGTYRALKESKIPVTEVSEYTQFPEMMDGRVKTLHPKIHGAILGRGQQDAAIMAEHQITPIDMVIVNLYPFESTIAADNCTLSDAVEQIDIGGPTMVRAAAKNFARVAIVVNPAEYGPLTEALKANQGSLSLAQRFRLAQQAFSHTAAYDSAIANYLTTEATADKLNLTDPSAVATKDNENAHFPTHLNLNFEMIDTMRYGENPHQAAAFYRERHTTHGNVANARMIQGKPLSFNNIADTDAALECVKSFDDTACVIVKHANPCGVAIGDTPLSAYQRAYLTDPTSSFGGIIAFNRAVDGETAEAIIAQQFVEVVIAPEIDTAALNAFATKPNVRVLACGDLATPPSENRIAQWDFKRVTGGLLVQSRDIKSITAAELTTVTARLPTAQELDDLLFCWKVAKYVKSNAIVYAKNRATVGVGAGQMSRVYSAKIAGIKASDEKLPVAGSVMASDAFFPFRDGIDAAAAAGITAVIQPGGSVRDSEVIAAADEAGMAMLFTGIRHFRH